MVPPRTHAHRPRLSSSSTRFAEAVLDGAGVVGVTALHGEGAGSARPRSPPRSAATPIVQDHFTPGDPLGHGRRRGSAGPNSPRRSTKCPPSSVTAPRSPTPSRRATTWAACSPSARLLVVDDVWRAAQLRPFLTGGAGCVSSHHDAGAGRAPRRRRARGGAVDGPESEATALVTEDLPRARPMRSRCWPRPTAGRCCCGWSTAPWPATCGTSPLILAHAVRAGAASGSPPPARTLPALGLLATSEERTAAVTATLEGSLALLGEHLPSVPGTRGVRRGHRDPPGPRSNGCGRTPAGLDPGRRRGAVPDAGRPRAGRGLLASGATLRLHDVVHRYLRHRVDDFLPALHRAAARRPPPPRRPVGELPRRRAHLLRRARPPPPRSCATPSLDALLAGPALDGAAACRPAGPAQVEADLAFGHRPVHDAFAAAQLPARTRTSSNRWTGRPWELVATLLSRLSGDPVNAHAGRRPRPAGRLLPGPALAAARPGRTRRSSAR